MYGSSLSIVIRNPLASRRAPMEAAAGPLPREGASGKVCKAEQQVLPVSVDPEMLPVPPGPGVPEMGDGRPGKIEGVPAVVDHHLDHGGSQELLRIFPDDGRRPIARAT